MLIGKRVAASLLSLLALVAHGAFAATEPFTPRERGADQAVIDAVKGLLESVR